MAEPYFIWKNVDSRNMGVVVNDYPPIFRPKKRGTTELVIPGRSGSLYAEEGDDVYEPYVRACPCYIRPSADVGAVINWLSGSGDAKFGNEATYVYHARIDTQFSLDKILRGHPHKSFTVPFICQPWKNLATPASNITVSQSGTEITNPGTLPSRPFIRVNGGGGDVTLTIGTGTAVEIQGTETSWGIIIDSEIRDVFNITRSQLRNSWMAGEFPLINPGANTVSWTGNVTSIVITPNWRWL
jgi:phage-related protein